VPGEDATAAVAEAYRAHYRRLVAVVYAATGNYAEAQDAVQEAYARALDRPRQFLEVIDPPAWLRTVALNIARQHWRRRQVFQRLLRLSQPDETVPGLSGDHTDLVRALRQLPRPTRETIVLHHLLDLPVAQVAEELGVSVGTVKARLSRGRAALGVLMEGFSDANT
jgi:RNA polymerase sigma-70 factor (ECF subfamily)